MKETIKLDRKQIREGYRKSAERCPVSIALQKHFGCECYVGWDDIILFENPSFTPSEEMVYRDEMIYRIGDQLQNAIEIYDDTGMMNPIEIEVIRDSDLLPPILELVES